MVTTKITKAVFQKQIDNGFIHARDLLSGAVKDKLTRVGVKYIQGVKVRHIKSLNKGRRGL